MLGRCLFAVFTCMVSLAVAGCAAVGESPSSAPSAALQGSSAGPTSAASDVPTTQPAPTTKPAKTPKPPKSTTPSTSAQSIGPSAPNLIITKFVTDVDQIVAGQHTSARVTIKNEGTVEAARFDIGVGYSKDDGLGFGGYSPTPVDGLGAGESVQVTVNISLDDAGAVTFTASADSGDVIAESNEDDNTATLSKSAVSMPNIAWGAKGFSVTEYPGDIQGYSTNIDLLNSGTADVAHNFKVSFAWSSDETSGTFPNMSCCALYGGVALTPGQEQTAGQGVYQFPTSGTYTVIATADPDNEIEESNETDNTATFQITIVQ